MKAIIQRVSEASVKVDNKIAGAISKGCLVFVAAGHDDTEKQAKWLADKIVSLRIFADENEKTNLSLEDVGGEILIVSQFSLLADCKKGRRPSFINAGSFEMAEKLYNSFVNFVKAHQVTVSTGIFGAKMEVSLVNDGPLTFILD